MSSIASDKQNRRTKKPAISCFSPGPLIVSQMLSRLRVQEGALSPQLFPGSCFTGKVKRLTSVVYLFDSRMQRESMTFPFTHRYFMLLKLHVADEAAAGAPAGVAGGGKLARIS